MRQRRSNIELLRIIGIIMIILFHCAYKSGFSFDSYFSFNKLIVKTLWMLGESGVNLFMLISGYFMVNSKLNWKKIALLLAEVLFYNISLTFVADILGIYRMSRKRELIFSFFPVTLNRYWFITAYIIVYILSPYLNVFAHSVSKISYKKFLFTMLVLYSFIPTTFGVLFNTTESLLYYNRLIWFIIMYFIGGYFRLYVPSIVKGIKTSVTICISAFALLVASILLIDKFDGFFALLGTTEVAYFWPPNTILILLFSVGIFGMFLNIKIAYNPLINRLASTTLGIYVLHDGVLSEWLWKSVIRCSDYQDSPWLFLRILIAAGSIFTIGVVIDLGRQVIEKYTLQKMLDSKLLCKVFKIMSNIGNDILYR